MDQFQGSTRVRTTLLWLALLFVLLLVPRQPDLHRPVTTDEHKWLTRSANFYLALSRGDLRATFQREHPGVTVMWMGALGIQQRFPDYPQVAPGQFSWEVEELEPWLRTTGSVSALDLLTATRHWVVLLATLVLTLAFVPLRRLFGVGAAALGTLLVGWSPLLMGLTRTLHPDALLAPFIYLTVTAFAAWLYAGRTRRDLLLAGVALGLAGLTKTPAFFIALAGGLAVGVELVRGQQPRRHLLRGYLLWGALAAMTFLLLWPAMWVAPVQTLMRIWAEMTVYLDSHTHTNFFFGQVVEDPGWFFYPLSWLLRTTPVTMAGLAAVGWLLVRPRPPLENAMQRRAALAILGFALVFLVGMSLGVKKFDRYAAPAFALVDLLGALGWSGLIVWSGQALRNKGIQRAALPAGALAVVIVLIQGGLAALYFPYYLTYYNPVAGGADRAVRIMLVGWGEGLDEAARWINQQPDGDQARVVSWYHEGSFSYYLHNDRPVMSFWSPDYWLEADYAVTYINQEQRVYPDRSTHDWFAGCEPVHRVIFRGVELARIYDLHGLTPPAFTQIFTDTATTYGDAIQLRGYTIGESDYLAGDELLVRFYFKALRPLAERYAAQLALHDAAGRTVWAKTAPLAEAPTAAWEPGRLIYGYQSIALPAVLQSGTYTVTLGVVDAAGRLLPSTAAAPTGTSVVVHEPVVFTLGIGGAVTAEMDETWGSVGLGSVRYAPRTAAGKLLMIDTLFHGRTDGSLKVSLRLQNAAGDMVAQADKEIRPDMHFELAVPPDLPAGRYALEAVVYDPVTMASIPNQDDQHQVPLVDIQIKKSREIDG